MAITSLVILAEALNFGEYEATERSQTAPFPGGAIAQVEGDWIYLK
ncbi:MAG: hypothetical protein V7K32_28655 [Nostoc sp.]